MSEPQGSENTRKLPVLEKSDDPGALGQSASAAAYEPLETLDDKDSRQGRFWSARRVPACVLAILLFVIAGFFLYDVAAVRAGRSALELRKWFARQLAERPLDDTAVLVGSRRRRRARALADPPRRHPRTARRAAHAAHPPRRTGRAAPGSRRDGPARPRHGGHAASSRSGSA